MQGLTIPNGYFQLWRIYLEQHHLAYEQCSAFQPYLDQLQPILAAPMAGQANYHIFEEIMLKTQTLLQCPQLSFELAKLIRPEHFGVLGYMATRCEGVSDALQYISRFSRLVIDGSEVSPLQVIYNGEQIQLQWPFHDEKYALINEVTMACMVYLAKQIFPHQQLNIIEISYAHSARMALYHYQKFYGGEVKFRQASYGLCFHADSLSLRSELADPSLMQLLLQQAEDAIAAKPKIEHVLKSIEQYIADYLRQFKTVPKVEQVAAYLYMSTRSLQRYLKMQESSFKFLVETERMKRCEQLLIQEMAFFDVAIELGYSDQSALARAYKAHTGQTLLQRKRQLKVHIKSV